MFPKIDLTNVRGVLIDIDNTLYAYEPAHQIAIEACYKKFLELYPEERITFNEFYKVYREKRLEVTQRLAHQGSCRSRLFAFQALLEESKDTRAYIHAWDLETLYWATLIENMVLSKDAKQFLMNCQAKEIEVCAITDMQAHFQIQKLSTLGVEGYVKHLVTSEEVGVEKPNRKIFQTALKKLSLMPDDVIMIGDNEEKDIMGAENMGIRSYRVDIVYD